MPSPRPSLLAVSGLPSLAGVWQADLMGASALAVQPTGYGALDAQLPGGGWPVGALTEVLQPFAGAHEWQLVLPALVQAFARRKGVAMLVAPPHEPFLPALRAQGVIAARLCRVAADGASAALWACEQALRCRDVLAVLAWLPQAPAAALRRLQLSAARLGQLLWVFRPCAASRQASPAPLRLQLEGGQALQVRILKRRGPPLPQAIELPSCQPLLAQVLAAQAERRRALQGNGAAVPWPGALAHTERRDHALDRLALAAG